MSTTAESIIVNYWDWSADADALLTAMRRSTPAAVLLLDPLCASPQRMPGEGHCSARDGNSIDFFAFEFFDWMDGSGFNYSFVVLDGGFNASATSEDFVVDKCLYTRLWTFTVDVDANSCLGKCD